MSIEHTSPMAVSVAAQARADHYNNLIASYEHRSNQLSGRKFEFFQKNDNAREELLDNIGIGIGTGAIVGGISGAIIGGCVGSPGGPPGAAIGFVAGGVVGAAIGGALGGGYSAYKLYPRYKEWCKTEAGEEFAKKISVFISEEKMLEHLICPITREPVIDGVRTPDGQLYEKSAIAEWIRNNGTNPKTRQALSEDQLTPDPTANFESAKAWVSFLTDKRDETINIAPQLQEGYDSFIMDIRESAMSFYNNKLVVLQSQYKNKKIDYKEFTAKSLEIQKYLDI